MSSSKNLSVVIPTYNCEAHLKTCLETVKWSDEIVIVDMGSSDSTVEVAKSYGAVVYIKYPNGGNFDRNRKYGMEKSTGKWILKLDSDESLSNQLQEEIKKIVYSNNSSDVNGYFLKNKVYIFGKEIKHGFIKPNSNEMRLFRRNCWKYSPFRFHQQITIKGKTILLNEYYFHFNHKNVSSFVSKTNKYTSLDAKYISKNKNLSTLEIVLAPIKTFTKLLILQKGLFDGFVGFEVSFMFSIYNLIEKIKVREFQRLS